METNAKILGLKICGIKNITKPLIFKFYKKTINNDFDFSEYNIKGIYGENGSGKTACIYSVQIMKNLILNRNYLKDENSQKALVALVNKVIKRGFIEVEYFFEIENKYYFNLYKIEFAINRENRFVITDESLKRKIGNNSRNKYIDVYKTSNGLLKYYSGSNSNYIDEISKNLLSEQTLSSIILDEFWKRKENNNPEIDDSFISFYVPIISTKVFIDISDNFKNKFIISNYKKIKDRDTDPIKQLFASAVLAGAYWDHDFRFNIAKSDIDDFSNYVLKLEQFIRVFKPELKKINIEQTEAEEYYVCRLIFVYEEYSIDLYFESAGIKKSVKIFDYLVYCVNGNIVFIDEIDTSINSIYLNKILEYISRFADGQLCFTAHNLSTMTVIKNKKKSIDFLSSINTVHTWSKEGNLDPESVYRKGFIDDSPFNVDAEDFIGVLGS